MTATISLQKLNQFIVQAKAATYVGDGQNAEPSRKRAHDLAFQDGDFSYLDSYFGGTDFIGQEVVYEKDEPVWAMNYYGRILQPEKITAVQAGQIIKQSLSKLYEEERFWGGFSHTVGAFSYTDTSQGDLPSFTGKEWITRNGMTVYELVYHGGMIKV
ncbi:MAG: hypothetical protein CL608_29635 [Anaerolineaceae bacterium]|nr:hypothetical protein [Anaerolineaceae bacterium]